MTLRSRLVFGTARLSGGPYAAQSRRLIEQCLKAGITRFDTAPGYGLGAAECLLGDVLDGVECVSIHTKVGSPRPGQPTLLGWAKWLRNLAPNRQAEARLDLRLERFSAPPPGNDYSAVAVAQSLEKSCENLRRQTLDLVLLHEAEPSHLPVESWQNLLAQRDAGLITRLGFAHFGPPQSSDPSLVAQIAPQPTDFLDSSSDEKRIYHSVRKAVRFACQENASVAASAENLLVDHGLDQSKAAEEYLLGILMLARSNPDASMIFATNRSDHLADFLNVLNRVDPAR